MGQHQPPSEDYRIPLSVFEAVNSRIGEVTSTSAPQEEVEEEKKEMKHERSRIEKDFLFPIHLIF